MSTSSQRGSDTTGKIYECTGALWKFNRPVTRSELLRVAEEAVTSIYCAGEPMSDPVMVGQWLQCKYAELQNETFGVMFLDSRHRLIAFERLFEGSIAGAEVHPRVVVQRALANNAAAVILSHNHPSGVSEPSTADRSITLRLRDALALVDVRVLDHFVVGQTVVSMAARGWL